MDDWKPIAEQLKYTDCLSWTKVYETMQPFFPDLNSKQVEEKVRGYLRTTDKYKAPKMNYKGNKKFKYNYNHTMHLYIIADAHNGAWGFDEKGFKVRISEIEKDPYAIVIILGDLIDNATLGSKGNVFSQKRTPQQQKESIIEMLYPIREKIIFVCAGNHCERTYKQTGSDIMYDICMGLGVLDKYNPVCGYIKISIGKFIYNIYATHNLGRSESKLKLMAKSFTGIDLFVAGHIHTPKHLTITQKEYGGQQNDSHVVIQGAWLKDENYAVSAAYEPCSTMQYNIILRGDRKKLEITT